MVPSGITQPSTLRNKKCLCSHKTKLLKDRNPILWQDFCNSAPRRSTNSDDLKQMRLEVRRHLCGWRELSESRIHFLSLFVAKGHRNAATRTEKRLDFFRDVQLEAEKGSKPEANVQSPEGSESWPHNRRALLWQKAIAWELDQHLIESMAGVCLQKFL